LGEENKDVKNRDGEEYKVVGALYTSEKVSELHERHFFLAPCMKESI